MNIVRRITRTPEHLATTITSEDENSWLIGCEGCGELRRQDKRSCRAIDPLVKEPEFVEITLTAPEARRCRTCGPFPKN